MTVLEPRLGWLQSWLPWLRWSPTSPSELEQAEERLLDYCNLKSTGYYVSAGQVGGAECRIWTRKFGPNTDKVPLVLVHGMGAGLAMFVLNFSALAANRTVYAIDLPGFGRSSRVAFSSSPSEVETEYVECLENWRRKVGLTKINLVGHSFGGHLTGLYALRYPQHLNTATLADPWGMTERPSEPPTTTTTNTTNTNTTNTNTTNTTNTNTTNTTNTNTTNTTNTNTTNTTNTTTNTTNTPPRRIPGWVRALAKVLVHFNPLWGLRAAGPAGPWLVARSRPDIIRKYEGLLGEENTRLVSDYIFHCNGHSPSGEAAFHRLMSGFGWANSPLLPRLGKLDTSVKLNVLYGSNSWMTHLEDSDFRQVGVEGEVEVAYIEGAGHHIYSDQAETFNTTINDLLHSQEPHHG